MVLSEKLLLTSYTVMLRFVYEYTMHNETQFNSFGDWPLNVDTYMCMHFTNWKLEQFKC